MITTNSLVLNTIAAHHTPSAYNAKTFLQVLPNGTKPIAVKPSASQSQNKTSAVKAKRKFAITNFEDFTNVDVFQIYPCPANDIINIDYKLHSGNNNYIELKIYDILGKVVFSKQTQNGNGKLVIDVASLTNGIYSVNITGSTNSIYIQKIVIQH
jgi:Secretion system C-terminal sorting domain